MSAALGSDSFDIDLELEGSQAGVAPIGVGVVVARRYRLEGVIGRGAIATVWRAHDLLLHRPVALKVLAPSPDDDDEVASYDRFLREARLCAAIRHPNVVDLLDVGTCEGRPFLVMEMLEGEPLDRLLSRVVQFGVEEAVSIAVDVLDGLAAAHDRGIVHRDLKPANVFVVREGGTMRAKILDFGLSRSVDRSRRSARTTVEGQIFGTPAYMSPEQARGSHALDARTDLYSAAVVLYECLAGVLPYESEALGDLIVEIVTREPPPLSRIRPDVGPVSDVLARAMAHRPEDRFASAREMKAALLDALERVRRDRSAPTIPVHTEPRLEDERTIVDAPALRVRPPRTPRRIDVPRVGGPRARERRRLRVGAIVGGLFVLGGAALGAAHVLPSPDGSPEPITPGPQVVPIASEPSSAPAAEAPTDEARIDAAAIDEALAGAEPEPAPIEREDAHTEGAPRRARRARGAAHEAAANRERPLLFRELDY